METRHVEIERFAKKADGYRTALEAAPEARILELSVVGAVLCGFCRSTRKSRNEIRIVDLMSGNGYLSSYLKRLGFGNVHAVEACEEMLPNAGWAKQAGVTLHRIKSIENVGSVLETIRPHIVVSLAGFHHLIHYDGTNKDRFRSVLWQRRVINHCVERLEREGLLLIVDIAERDAALGLQIDRIEFWQGDVFREASICPDDLREKLIGSDSISGYEEVVTERIGLDKISPTLRWFREIVDEKTSIGHDDVALSKELLELLGTEHRIAWAGFSCPWLFSSREEAAFFLTRKFGFLIDRKIHEVDDTDILAQAASVSGLHEIGGGKIAFGWNLGALTIRGPNREKFTDQALIEVNGWLILLCTLLVSRASLGWFASGVFSQAKEWLDQIGFLFAGGAAAAVMRWWQEARLSR